MTAFLQDDTGDLALGSNAMAMTAGKTEVMQTLRSRLRVFQGECYLDVTAGAPWFQQVLGKAKSTRNAEAAIKGVILGVPDVKSLVEFSFTLDKATRTAALEFKVDTTFGTVSLQEVL